MVDGLFQALPGDRALLSPSQATMRSIVANLTPASGRQDHMALPYVAGAFVSCSVTSTASRPAFVTIAKRPFCRNRTILALLLFYQIVNPNSENQKLMGVLAIKIYL